MLTDLELAKLLSHGGTVSANWSEDKYRAPEVAEGEAHPQADFYSWARIFVHISVGELADWPADANALAATAMPDKLLAVARECLSPNWKKRPKTARQILKLFR